MAAAMAKVSDDPMDLGGFMQNFVLSNPFKEMRVLASDGEKDPSPSGGGSVGDRPRSADDKTTSSDGPSPASGGVGVGPTGQDADRALGLGVDNRQVLDTPKAHVGSNVVFAAALKLQKVSGVHAKVQKWLKNNYIHEPSYPLCKDARELIAEVQEHFPHITNMTLSKIMTFTFPNSVKVTNISGFHGYKGLLGKPQPEDYCNLDLLKAVSHCKLYGSISEAAQMFNVPASSVASLHYWHPDLSSLPVHISVAEELAKKNQLVYSHLSPGTELCKPSCILKHQKRSAHPGEYCDCSDCLTDREEEQSTDSNTRHLPHVISNKALPAVKVEPQEMADGDSQSEVSITSLNDEHQVAYSLLRSLLRQPRLERYDRKVPDLAKKCRDGVAGLQGEVAAIKSEPASSGYEDCDGDGFGTSASDKRSDSHNDASDSSSEPPAGKVSAHDDSASSDSPEVADLRTEVKRLKSHLSEQISKNRKQEVELLLSQRETLHLKSTLCAQEVTIAELAQDFDNLQQQFSLLRHKFKRALDQLDKEHSPPAKKKYETSINGSKS